MLGHPFPLIGKGRDRGAQKPIKPILPTFVPSAGLRTGLPHRREGIAKGVEIDGEFGPNRRVGKAGHRKGRHYQGRVSSEERRGVGDEPTKLIAIGLTDSAARTLILNGWNVWNDWNPLPRR
jgi:hypothetical protein